MWCLWVGVGVLGMALLGVKADLPDQDCPDDCDCHYFRINWVTDCSESNLTAIPTEEEGLSLNVYILNMNANNMVALEPFPPDLKVSLGPSKSYVQYCSIHKYIKSQG